METNKKIIEIEGVKLEVDMRYATRGDQFKVGDKVKILMKGTCEEKHTVYPGVIVGFEDFQKLPTIIIAYLKIDYSTGELKFAHFNAETDIEIVHAEDDYLPIEKAGVLEQMDREILKKEQEVLEMQRKKAYFLNHFNHYFDVKDLEG